MTNDLSVRTPESVVEPTLLAAQSWIQKTPGVCGGEACVRNTRITVAGLVEWRKLGLSDAEIIQRIQGVTQADLDAAWSYHGEHRDEIERATSENDEA